jgi:hypothetical protein
MKTYIFIQFENGYIDFWAEPSRNLNEFLDMADHLRTRLHILRTEPQASKQIMNAAISKEQYEIASWLRDDIAIKQGYGKPSVYAVRIPDRMGEITLAIIDENQQLRKYIIGNRIENTNI